MGALTPTYPEPPAAAGGSSVSGGPQFRYAERTPPPELRSWIANYWAFEVLEGGGGSHVVPPDGCTSLVFGIRPGGTLLASGPWLEPLVVPVAAGERYAGFRIRPGAARELIGADPGELVNRAQPAVRWLGAGAAELERLLGGAADIGSIAARLDAAFLRRLPELAVPDSVVGRAARLIDEQAGEVAIASIAAELGISPRTLLRRFRAAAGLTPKQYARIQRLRATAERLLDGPTTWSRLAARGGYADQPHLTREVVTLVGVTPGEFARRVRATVHDRPPR